MKTALGWALKSIGYKSAGYTIIEVMLFLAISGVIFAGAATVFNGQSDKTAFEQGMRDFNSQLQKYVDEVSTSVFNSGRFNCTTSASSGRPTLSVGTNAQGTNQDCMFLGRALQVVPGEQKIYVYTVLGNKNSSTGEPATSFAAAMPTPAFSSDTDLTDEYFAPWGKITSSKVTTTAGVTSDSDLVGFYNSLQEGYQNSGVTGAQSIVAKGYPYTSTDINSNRSAAVAACIEELDSSGVTCAITPIISTWALCFASTRSNNQTALLTISSTPAGITTNINYTACT